MSRSWGIGFPGTWYFSPGVEFIPPLGHMNPATCKLIPHTAFHCRRYSLRPSDYWIIVPKLRYSTFLDGHWTFGHLCRILVGIIIPVGWAAAHPNSGSAQDYRYPLSGGRWHTWELKDSPGFRAGRPGHTADNHFSIPTCKLIPHTAFHCRRHSLRPSDYRTIMPKLRYSTFGVRHSHCIVFKRMAPCPLIIFLFLPLHGRSSCAHQQTARHRHR